jgi:cytochrome c-type biogenesis protein CcmF
VTFNPQNSEYLKNTHDAGIGVQISIEDEEADTTYHTEATIGLQGALMYTYPGMCDDVGMRFKIHEKSIDNYFTPEDKLTYQTYVLKTNDIIDVDGRKISIVGFEQDPKNARYAKQEGDIAISAKININYQGQTTELNPIYIIRGNQPMSIKEFDPSTGTHIRFSNIDPVNKEFSFKIATNSISNSKFDIDIATNAPRSDYVILMASIFPGINLFWVGSIFMLVGLFMAAYDRLKWRYK